jgi:hypothetical protein
MTKINPFQQSQAILLRTANRKRLLGLSSGHFAGIIIVFIKQLPSRLPIPDFFGTNADSTLAATFADGYNYYPSGNLLADLAPPNLQTSSIAQ